MLYQLWQVNHNNYIVFLLLSPPILIGGKFTWATARKNRSYENFMPIESCINLHGFQSHLSILLDTYLCDNDIVEWNNGRDHTSDFFFFKFSSMGVRHLEHVGSDKIRMWFLFTPVRETYHKRNFGQCLLAWKLLMSLAADSSVLRQDKI